MPHSADEADVRTLVEDWRPPSVFGFGFFGSLLVASCGIKQVSAAQLAPVAIEGSWVSRCAAGLPDRINFAPTGAKVVSSSGALTCHLAHYRSLSEARWYLDLECQDGSLLQLDVYRVARDELLLARRPLGEACRYKRS